MVTIVTSPVSPTRASQLQPGTLYAICGQGGTIGMLPAQVFRLESYTRNLSSGTLVLVGTLYWRIWVDGRAFSGRQQPHYIAVHGVSIGKGLSGKHDFHLERLQPHQVRTHLGTGRIYEEYLADEQSRIDAELKARWQKAKPVHRGL